MIHIAERRPPLPAKRLFFGPQPEEPVDCTITHVNVLFHLKVLYYQPEELPRKTDAQIDQAGIQSKVPGSCRRMQTKRERTAVPTGGF